MTTEAKATRMNMGTVGTCPTTGKRMLLTRAAAKRQKRMLGDRTLHVFRCPYCNHFHLGHQGHHDRAHHRALHTPQGGDPMPTTTPPHSTPERCGSCGAYITDAGHCRCS